MFCLSSFVFCFWIVSLCFVVVAFTLFLSCVFFSLIKCVCLLNVFFLLFLCVFERTCFVFCDGGKRGFYLLYVLVSRFKCFQFGSFAVWEGTN